MQRDRAMHAALSCFFCRTDQKETSWPILLSIDVQLCPQNGKVASLSYTFADLGVTYVRHI